MALKTTLTFFVGRPLLVNLITVFVLLAGAASLSRVVFSAFPDFDYGLFTILAEAPGRNAEDVELGVTVPLEEELLKVDGLQNLVSKSVAGFSAIEAAARDGARGAELDALERDLQRAVDRASARLPIPLAERPIITAMHPGLEPVIELMVSGSVSEELLRQVARRFVSELRELPGVAGIDQRGDRDREVHILLDPLAMQRLGVSYREIEAAIAERNITASGGALRSATGERDVVVAGRFSQPKAVAELIVRANDYGNYIRVRDVAQVVAGYEDWSVQSFADGVPGIYLGVRRGSQASEIDVVARVAERIARLQRQLPEGVEVRVVNDMARMTTSMLSTLAQNGAVGMLMVFLALRLFFPWRAALWVAIGVPVAIMAGTAAMPAFGLTVNQFTLAAVIMMLGLLVDDAVVTAESIFRHHDRGLPPSQAAISGAAAVAPAVITGAVTTLLAFAPLAFLGGNEGKFMWMLPAMVMLMIAASLAESKLILPCHLAQALHAVPPRAPGTHWFRAIESAYGALLTALLRRRYRSLCLLTAGFVGIVATALTAISVDLYPDSDVDQLYVRAQMPAGSSFAQTREATLQLEARIHQLIGPAELQHTRVTVGTHDIGRVGELFPGSQSDRGLINVILAPAANRSVSAGEISRLLRRELQGTGGIERVAVLHQGIGPPVGAPVEVQIIGNGAERGVVADEILGWLRGRPDVIEAWSSYEPGRETLNLAPRHEAVAAAGLTVADIAQAARVALDGVVVGELQTLDDRIRYRLQLNPDYAGRAEALRSLTLINGAGEPVPLRSLVDFRLEAGAAAITHHFGDRVETVYAEIDRDATSVMAINDALAHFMHERNHEGRYPDLRIRRGGELVSQGAALGELGAALVVILAAMLLIMALLFHSLWQPLIVLLQVPLGFSGVLLAFLLHGIDLSVTAIMGFLGLSGVLVNGAIVLIDNLNRYRRQGLVAQADIVRGSVHRLRPIAITTLTSAAGLAPAAYGLMGANPFLTPMIMAMLWGIAFGTLITLFYVPALYAVGQDLGRLGRRGQSPSPVAVTEHPPRQRLTGRPQETGPS